jgi:hypothetical protein
VDSLAKAIQSGQVTTTKHQFRSVSIELCTKEDCYISHVSLAHIQARRPEIWLEAVLPNSELENNPAAKAAWDKFQTIASLD